MQQNPTQAEIAAAGEQFARIGLADAEKRRKERVAKLRTVLEAYTANGSSFEGLAEVDGDSVADKRQAFRRQNAEVLALKERIAEIKAMAAGLEDTAENDAHADEIRNRAETGGERQAERRVLTGRESVAERQQMLLNRVRLAAGIEGDDARLFRHVAMTGGVEIEGPESTALWDVTNLVSTSAGMPIYEDQTARVVPGVRPQVRIIDIINRVTTTSNMVVFRRQTQAGTEQLKNTAATKAGREARGWKVEGTASPAEADYRWEKVMVPISLILGFTQATKEQLEDEGGMDMLLLQQLRMDLRRNMELALLHGGGSDQEPAGLFGTGATTLAHAAPGANSTNYGLDFLARAMYDEMFEDTELMPTHFVMNPIDWRKLITTRDGDGNLQFMDPQDVAQQMVLGTPVILSKYTKLDSTAGTVLCANFAEGGALFDRQMVEVERTNAHAGQFIAANETFRATARMGVGRFYNGAFVNVTGFDGKKTA